MMKMLRLLLALGLPLAIPARAAEPTRIRFLSYNIHHAEGTDGKLDLERIARVIRAVEPHVVALQEVDRGVERSKRVDEPAELGRLTGMTPVFEWNIHYQGGDYGNAVLSRLPVVGHQNHKLPSHYAGEQRGVLSVELKAPDTAETPFRLLATHLDYRPRDSERLDSVKRIEQLAGESPDRPTLLVGDLNATPGSPTLRAFEAGWQSATSMPRLTFPSNKPNRQIDHVLVRPAGRWRAVESRVLDEPVASDHRPLLVVLELLGEPKQP